MDRWRLDIFKSLLGQTVTVKDLSGENECEFQVSEVVESSSLGEGWESFSVMFSSDREIGQGSVEITHAEHGNTTVFLNPKSETQHEAIFNYQI